MLALLPHSTFGAPEYLWTDNIKIYKDATTVHADIRTFTNNETLPIDVTAEIVRKTSVPSIQILQHYRLSANETDFIIISEGKVIQAKSTYYGLNPGERLCFTVEAKPKSSTVEGETATVEVRISYPLPTGDNPPTCSIVDPVDAQTLSGVYRVKVNATDDGQVSTVELSIDSGSWIDVTGNFDGTHYYYDWNTTTVPDGSHTLDARATDIVAQTTYASQVTVTVDNVPGETMHVESIDFKQKGPRWLDIMVTVYDDGGSPVTGATVYMDITYPDESVHSVSAVTIDDGVATYQINRPEKGTYTVTVTNVTHETFIYDSDANKETTDSYTVT
ncbi:hypothetical protein ES702_03042 [subsurface metagenome]